MAETTTILGKVMVTPKGAWSSGTAYEVLDIVTDSGNSYLAKQPVQAGTALSNTAYWLQITEKGDKGDTATIAVGTVTTGAAGSDASITNSGDTHDATFNFTIPRGDTGNGIASVVLLSSALNVDTYRITFTDGDHFDYNVTNASSGVWGSITGDLEDQTDLQSALDEKAFAIEKSETGSIVSVTDASPVPPSALTVGIEPVQDLNGYGNPWPAGGGKNQCVFLGQGYYASDGTVAASSKNGRTKAVFVENGESIVFSAGVSGVSRGIVVFSDAELTTLLYRGTSWTDAQKHWLVYTATQDCYVSFWYNYDNSTDASQTLFETAQLQIEVGTSSATDYAPYSNICPITGHTSATVARTGKNLLPSLTVGTYENKGITATVESTGLITVSGTKNADGSVAIDIPLTDTAILPSGTYFHIRNSVIAGAFDFRDGATAVSMNAVNRIVATTAPITTDTIRLYYGSSTTSVNQTLQPSIELTNEVTDFVPYSGTSVTIALGQTVYGGSLNVLTGVLTVKKVAHIFDGTESFTNSSGRYSYIIDDYPVDHDNNTKNAISNFYQSATPNELWSNKGTADYCGIGSMLSGGHSYILIVDNVNLETPNVNTYKSFLATQYANGTPLTVVWDLATPLTVQLTANTLSLLQGANNVWADTGNIAVTYKADTKTYIDNKIAESALATRSMLTNVETAMVATKNYTSGEIVIVGNDVLKLTSNVGNGTTLVIGTNCTKVTIADWVLSLIV